MKLAKGTHTEHSSEIKQNPRTLTHEKMKDVSQMFSTEKRVIFRFTVIELILIFILISAELWKARFSAALRDQILFCPTPVESESFQAAAQVYERSQVDLYTATMERTSASPSCMGTC